MSRPHIRATAGLRRVVVFCPNLIGDTVMATPTLRALRTGLPDATIVGVVRPQVAPTLDGAPWLDDLLLFDHRSRDRSRRTVALLDRLRAGRFEAAVLLPNSYRSAIVARLAGIPRRIGYDKGGRGWLLTDRLRFPTDASGRRLPTPIVGTYLELARRLGCPPGSSRLELFTTEADERAADLAWEWLGLGDVDRVVALNTGGAYGPAKNWPIGHFADLALRLVADPRTAVLILCGPAERVAAREVAMRADHPRVVSLAGRDLSIGLSKAVVRRSALLVTTDSGPRHFAAAFGVPVVTLFGPTHIGWTRTQHPGALHLLRPLPCGPCQRPTCPLGHHRCMTELDPADVHAAALRLLGRPPSFHPSGNDLKFQI